MNVTVEDITGVVGLLPTPAVAGAGRWSTQISVDLVETARMIRLMERSGTRILLSNGTFGEGACMTAEDEQAFVDAIVQTIAGDTLLFAGITTLNTRETIRRGRALMGLGAHGLFLGRPMWLSLDQADIVTYYADIAEALPGVPLLIYDNPLAFKAPIATDTYRALSHNKAIVASKHAGGPAIERDMNAVEGRMRLLPIETLWAEKARRFPDAFRACWSGSVCCAPEPIAALARAVERGDWASAEAIGNRMAWADSAMLPKEGRDDFMNYIIQISHARFLSAGFIDPGPPRPPYLHAPETYLEGGRECGRRWRLLAAEFRQAAAA